MIDVPGFSVVVPRYTWKKLPLDVPHEFVLCASEHRYVSVVVFRTPDTLRLERVVCAPPSIDECSSLWSVVIAAFEVLLVAIPQEAIADALELSLFRTHLAAFPERISEHQTKDDRFHSQRGASGLDHALRTRSMALSRAESDSVEPDKAQSAQNRTPSCTRPACRRHSKRSMPPGSRFTMSWSELKEWVASASSQSASSPRASRARTALARRSAACHVGQNITLGKVAPAKVTPRTKRTLLYI